MVSSHRGKDSKAELNLVKTLRFHLCVNVNEKLQILYFQHCKSLGSLFTDSLYFHSNSAFLQSESICNYAFLRPPWSSFLFLFDLSLMESRQFFWS